MGEGDLQKILSVNKNVVGLTSTLRIIVWDTKRDVTFLTESVRRKDWEIVDRIL